MKDDPATAVHGLLRRLDRAVLATFLVNAGGDGTGWPYASLVLVAGFSELDRSLEMNFRMRLKMLDETGLSDALAMHISMWTLGRSFLDTDDGKGLAQKLLSNADSTHELMWILQHDAMV